MRYRVIPAKTTVAMEHAAANSISDLGTLQDVLDDAFTAAPDPIMDRELRTKIIELIETYDTGAFTHFEFAREIIETINDDS